MFVFGKLAEKLSQIKVNEITQKAIQQNETEIVNMNTKDQIFDKGVNVDNSKIQGTRYDIYSPRYTNEKRDAGKYQGHVDLSFSGKYLKTYKAYFFIDSFIIRSVNHIRDGKNLSQKLRDQYGEKFEGLTNKNISRIPSIIINDFSEIFKTKFNNAVNQSI